MPLELIPIIFGHLFIRCIDFRVTSMNEKQIRLSVNRDKVQALFELFHECCCAHFAFRPISWRT